MINHTCGEKVIYMILKNENKILEVIKTWDMSGKKPQKDRRREYEELLENEKDS